MAFVDIGANDGVTYSNSLFLNEKLDRKCIEPHPIMFKNFLMHGIVIALMHVFKFSSRFSFSRRFRNMLSGISQFMDDRHLQRIDEEIYQHGGKKRIISVEAISPKHYFIAIQSRK